MDLINQLRILNRKKNYKIKEIKADIKEFLFLQKYNKKKKGDMKINNIKNIAINLTGKGIGDTIIISGFINLLKDNGFTVYIICQKRISFLFQQDNIIDTDSILQGKNSYDIDLFIDLFDYIHLSDEQKNLLQLIYYLNPRYAIGFNHHPKIKVFNNMIEYTEYQSHITRRIDYICPLLNLSNINYKYSFPITKDEEQKAENFLELYVNKKIIILNPFASCDRRSLSYQQVDELLKAFSKIDNIVVIVTGILDEISKITTYHNSLINKNSSFFFTASLIKKSSMVISVDTSIVHLCNALNAKLISIYSSELGHENNLFINNFVFAPNYDNAIQLIAPNDAAKYIDIKEILALTTF